MRSDFVLVIAAALVIGIGSNYADADDIAFSLVHHEGRVDIPVGDVVSVDAEATFKLRNRETGVMHEFAAPRVTICLSPEIQDRVCDFTRRFVSQRVDLVVDCETLTKVNVIEPLCTRACHAISVFDITDAKALVQRIRRGSNRACAPSS
jgi:hypothetical protein